LKNKCVMVGFFILCMRVYPCTVGEIEIAGCT
jgi:hypothetical protein